MKNLTLSASNRLYKGEVSGLAEAIRLHAQALEEEAQGMDSICEVGDDFPERLRAEAKEARQLLADYTARVTAAAQAEEEKVLQEWLNSGNEKAKTFAEVAHDGCWEDLAV